MKDAVFSWTDGQQQAFQQIKCDIGEAPKLKPFCTGKECIITVNASLYGLDGVLSQRWGKEEWNVTFASRTLKDTERKYAAIKKELLGCAWTI